MNPAMTPQQRAFTDPGSGKLSRYKSLLVGDQGWGALASLELYQLLGSLPGILGMGFRSVILPRLLRGEAKGIAIGKGVTIRHPHRITLGKGVIVDDFSCLDIRQLSPETDPSITIGERSLVGRHSIILTRNSAIEIGDGVNIGSYCRIATDGKISIGDSTLIAAYCYIGPGNHNFDDPTQPIMEQGMAESRGVVIGKNVWIGTRCTVLDGVTIGDNAIVGAHSLVSSDIPAGAIAYGTPAKVVRVR